MKDVDDYRWISLEDRGSGRAPFSGKKESIEDMREPLAGTAVAHTEWQWLSDINDRFAGGIAFHSLPVIQID